MPRHRRFFNYLLFTAFCFLFLACGKEENCAIDTANATIYETYYEGGKVTDEYIRCGFFEGSFRVIDEAFRELSVTNWEGLTKNKIDFVFAGQLVPGVYYAENKELFWSYVDVYCDVIHHTELFGEQVYLRPLEDVTFNLQEVSDVELSAVVTGTVTLSANSYVEFRLELNDVPYNLQTKVPGN